MNPPSLNEITQLGYKVVGIIADTGRNRALKVQKDGHFYFAKLNLTKDPILLENDVWWCLTLDRLRRSNPDLSVRSPQIIQFGNGWYVAEFVPGRVLTAAWETSSQELAPYTETLARILIQLDALIVSPHPTPLYETSESAPYTNLLKKVDGWMERPLAVGLITPTRLRQAKDLIEKHRASIRPAFQHGDFVPWHLMTSEPGEPLVIIDGEHASLVKPRYYDLAYAYSRIITRTNAQSEARHLLKSFLDISKVDTAKFYQAFIPVLTLRALGMQTDAMADLERLDYRSRSQGLLERCLSQELDCLLR